MTCHTPHQHVVNQWQRTWGYQPPTWNITMYASIRCVLAVLRQATMYLSVTGVEVKEKQLILDVLAMALACSLSSGCMQVSFSMLDGQ